MAFYRNDSAIESANSSSLDERCISVPDYFLRSEVHNKFYSDIQNPGYESVFSRAKEFFVAFKKRFIKEHQLQDNIYLFQDLDNNIENMVKSIQTILKEKNINIKESELDNATLSYLLTGSIIYIGYILIKKIDSNTSSSISTSFTQSLNQYFEHIKENIENPSLLDKYHNFITSSTEMRHLYISCITYFMNNLLEKCKYNDGRKIPHKVRIIYYNENDTLSKTKADFVKSVNDLFDNYEQLTIKSDKNKYKGIALLTPPS